MFIIKFVDVFSKAVPESGSESDLIWKFHIRYSPSFHCVNRLKMVQVVGKRSRPVPVLLTEDVVQCMDGLRDTRLLCAVPQDNTFVFAVPGTKGHLNFFNVLRRTSTKAELKRPHLLTTTRVRKHLATVAQVCEHFTCIS